MARHPGLVPNSGVGTLTFRPDGTVTNVETILIGGLGAQPDININGSYSVHWDTGHLPALCKGTIHETAGGAEYNFDITVSDDGKRIEMIHTDKGLIVSLSAFPMKTMGCHNSTMQGKYTYNARGWALATPDVPNDQMLSGYIAGVMSGAMGFYPQAAPSRTDFPDAAAGSGSVRAWDSLSVNGQPMRRLMTGWYKVQPDCSGTIVLRDNLGYPDFQIEFYIGQDEQTVFAVNVNTIDVGAPAPVPMFLFPITLNRAHLNEDLEHSQKSF